MVQTDRMNLREFEVKTAGIRIFLLPLQDSRHQRFRATVAVAMPPAVARLRLRESLGRLQAGAGP